MVMSMNAPFFFFLNQYVDAVNKHRLPALLALKGKSHPFVCGQVRLLVCLAYHVKRAPPWYFPQGAENADFAYFASGFDKDRWAKVLQARVETFEADDPERETRKVLRILEAFLLMAVYGEPAQWPVRDEVRKYICDAPVSEIIDFAIDAAVDWLANPENTDDP